MDPALKPVEIKSGDVTFTPNKMRELMSKNEKESGLKTIVNRLLNIFTYGYMNNEKLFDHLHDHITKLPEGSSVDEDTKTLVKELSMRILGSAKSLEKAKEKLKTIGIETTDSLKPEEDFLAICKYGDPKSVEMMIKSFPSIDEKILTAGLTAACENNNAKVRDCLLLHCKKSGMDIQVNEADFLAICTYGDPKSLEMMIKSFPKMDEKILTAGLTAACENNNAKVIEFLLPHCKKSGIDTHVIELLKDDYCEEPTTLTSPSRSTLLMKKAILQFDIPALAYSLNCLPRFDSDNYSNTDLPQNNINHINTIIKWMDEEIKPKLKGWVDTAKIEKMKKMLENAQNLPSIDPKVQKFSSEFEKYNSSTPEKKKELRNIDLINKYLDKTNVMDHVRNYSLYQQLLPDLLEDTLDSKTPEFEKILQLLTRFIKEIPHISINDPSWEKIINNKINILEIYNKDPQVLIIIQDLKEIFGKSNKIELE